MKKIALPFTPFSPNCMHDLIRLLYQSAIRQVLNLLDFAVHVFIL